MATEIDDIYTSPDYVKRIYFNKRNKAFVDEIKEHAMDVCRKKISQQYINRALKIFTDGYVYVNGKMITGFIIWNIIKTESNDQPTKILQVLLLCAEKTNTTFGYKILDDIETYAAKNGISFISLELAYNELEPYYKKFGFFRTNVPLFNKIRMSKPVNILLNSNFSRSRRGTQKSKHRYDPIPKKDRALISFYNNNFKDVEAELLDNMNKYNELKNKFK
jgi:hypothetical protein